MPDASATGPVDPSTASRSHLIAARILAVVAVLLTVVSVYANFAKREALDPSHFRETSRKLIADATVRDRLAARLVDDLYANVDVPGALRGRLPANLRPLAGPIAGSVRDAAEQAARRLLEEPRVQDAFVAASMAAHRQFIALLNDDFTLLRTSGGKVVLDVRPLDVGLGNRFSLVPDLDARIPPGATQITILESSRLETAQTITRVLRFVADWIWIFALAAAVAAVWLARGQRRIEVRALGVGLVIAGFLILIVRTISGRYFVDKLASSPAARPATATVYSILTTALSGSAWTAILTGVVALAGIWLAGPGPRAVSARRALAPYMRRPELTYGTFALLYLLLIWWEPTPQFGAARTAILWFVLAIAGVEVLRRQMVREFPHDEPADLVTVVRGWFTRRPRAKKPHAGSIDDLERVARLHASGALDDREYAAWKTQLLDPGPPARQEGDTDAAPVDPAPPGADHREG